MNLAFDICAVETLAERTERLRALRLGGPGPQKALQAEPIPIHEAPAERAERLLMPTEEQRRDFIIECWGDLDCPMSTYTIAAAMAETFGIPVHEAEVCRVLKRHGEQREEWTGDVI
jgi:hypothetical protein